jgi:DNA-binding response OmpR family regulator
LSIQKDIRILVVDDDRFFLNIMDKLFKSKDIPVVTTDSPVEAARLLKVGNFEIVITDINMPVINGFELILWMKKNKIKTNIIVLSSNYTEAMQKSYSRYGVLRFMSKPVNFENLLWSINVIRNEGFVSNVSDISLFDYLQMNTFAKKDIIISVKSGGNNIYSLIYLKQGDIIHAVHENLKGEAAFYKIMGIKGGNFTEQPFQDPEEITITVPASSIIFRAGEVIDEENMKKLSRLPPEQQKLSKADLGYRVLITDDDENACKLIGEYLGQFAGINVETSGSAVLTAKLLQEKLYELAIIDIDMPEVNGFELLLWMKKNNIFVKTILMSEEDSEEIKNYAIQQGAVKFFHKSSSIQDLFEFIKQDNLTGFTGTVSKISIFDYVQMIMLSRKNKVIVVHSPLSNFEGLIYFKHGNIIHAVLGDLKGKDAFFKIVAIKGGIISEIEWREPEEISITGPSTSLLFKATQYLDMEMLKLEELNIDDQVVQLIEDRINNFNLADKNMFTSTGNFKRPPPPPAEEVPKVKLTPFIKAQNTLKASTPMFSSAPKPKTGSIEDDLKLFDGMKYIIPILSKAGENVLSDPSIPINTYQLLKKLDGKNSLEYIYQNYYYHISINDFFNKFDNIKNYFQYEKKPNTPADKELKGKIIQILVYLKFLDPKELAKKMQDDSLAAATGGFMSGELLLKFELISNENLSEALFFQKKFNQIIDSLTE